MFRHPTVGRTAALLLLLLPAFDRAPVALAGPPRAGGAAGQLGRFEPGGSPSARTVEPFLAHLVRLSGGGLLDVERAAFLIEETGGGYRCELWPFHNGHRRATYRGAVPVGTVAIAHTHPIDVPEPSENDREQAVRLGLPMLVASPWSVYEVAPDGQVRALARNERWMERPRETATCERPRSPAAPADAEPGAGV